MTALDVLMSFYLGLYKKAMTLTEQLLTSVRPIAGKSSTASVSAVGWQGDFRDLFFLVAALQ